MLIIEERLLYTRCSYKNFRRDKNKDISGKESESQLPRRLNEKLRENLSELFPFMFVFNPSLYTIFGKIFILKTIPHDHQNVKEIITFNS